MFFMEKRKKKKMRYYRLFRGISLILLITTLIFLIKLSTIDVLGIKYMTIVCIIIGLLELLILFILNKRFKMAIKVPFTVVALIFSGVFIYGTYNLNVATDVVSKIVSGVVKEEKYDIYVLKTSKYESTKDLNKAKLGIYNNGDSLEEAIKQLKKSTTFQEETPYDDIEKLFTDGVNKKIDAIFIGQSMNELLAEEYPSLLEQFKIIGEITVSTKENIKKSDVKVTKEPFLIYVSGIDTYGSIGTVSRSDVNMLIAVNPKTEKILLVNTPRDYYVKLHSKKAMDKLTHAGIYGVEESMKTLEDLYATDVDFYLKINFSSLIKIVDALGGISVNSKYNFSYDGHTFHKGVNQLNGAAALAFSRCRKELPYGDVSRGENQEAVISGIINKISSPTVISKYSQILKTMSKSFVTNMSEDDIYSLAKYQLNENPKWTVESKNAIGTDASRTTYSAGRALLYVMLPKEESVTEVKNALNTILEE